MDIILNTYFNNSLLPRVQQPGFFDNFDRPVSDTAQLSMTSGEGKLWRYDSTGIAPVWRCDSLGRAVNRSGDLRNFAWLDGLATNGKLKVTAAALGSTRKGGPVFRYQDALNHLFAVQATAGAPISLYKRVAGSSYILATSSYVPVDGDVYEVELNGQNIILRVNGSTVVTATESAFLGETRMGLYGSSDSFSMAWDDIRFTPTN
jgi:hypothetical protein